MNMILRMMCYYSSIITMCLFRWHTPNIDLAHDFGYDYEKYSKAYLVLDIIGHMKMHMLYALLCS